MKISETIYNAAGELMAPRSIDVKLNRPFPGGRPELEDGFYYAFKFEGSTQNERAQKRQRFFTEMKAVPRFMALSVREYRVQMDSYVRYGVEVLYVIESAEGASRRTPVRAVATQQTTAQPSMLDVIRGTNH